MTNLDLKKLFPHGETDYRNIAFLLNSLPYLGDQYEYPQEGVAVSLQSIGWGIEPAILLSSLIEENSKWLDEQGTSPEYELAPNELFCDCFIRNEEQLLEARKSYFAGVLDWAKLLHSWHIDIQEASGILYTNGTLMDFQTSYGQPNWDENPKLEKYREEITKITTAFWQDIYKHHLDFLEVSKLIATYDIFEPAWEFRSLGGCFYHVTTDDGPIKLVLPEENLIEQFCQPETDCVQFGEDSECTLDHECLDDSLEDMRHTLTLLN